MTESLGPTMGAISPPQTIASPEDHNTEPRMPRIELGSPGLRVRVDPPEEKQEDHLAGYTGQRITSDSVILTRKLDCPELVFNQSLFED